MYFFDIYTVWCGWCKVMDKKTFTDPEVAKLLNDNFANVKFDAEQKENIQLNGKNYGWRAAGKRGINELAVELLGQRLSYPSFVILDENFKIIKVIT